MPAPQTNECATLKSIKEIKPHTFIFAQGKALPIDVCNEMVRRFETQVDEQYEGRIGQTVLKDRTIKQSTDLVISGKEHWKDIDHALFRSLSTAIREFREVFPYFKGPFKDSGYAMQRTATGEFYHWHIDGGSHEFSQRQLVAVWYLNDVLGPGGETEFLFQGLKVRPEAGKLLLFPPFWTHEHRGTKLHQG
ncbi:MAG: 2OG-Fe(II) oxygenase, partial [Gammaproteobacteria bacterium]